MKQQKYRQFGKEIQYNQEKKPNDEIIQEKRPSPKAKSKRIQNIPIHAYDKENKIEEPITIIQKDTSIIQVSTLQRIEFKIQAPTDPQDVELYRKDIINWMKFKESKQKLINLINPEFIKWQRHIVEDHRSLIIDYIMKLCKHYKLKDETLFMTVEIMDSYLSAIQVEVIDIEQLANTCLFIACKYEEIYPPSLDRLIQRTGLSKYNILMLESKILEQRKFDMIGNTTLSWLNIIKRSPDYKELPNELFNFAQFILESSLYRTTMYQFPSSSVAKASIFTASKWMKLDLTRVINARDAEKYDCLYYQTLVKKLSCILNNTLEKKDRFLNQRYKGIEKTLELIKSDIQ